MYFAAMLASGCIENQYRKGKEQVVINVHFKKKNLIAVGDTTYAYLVNKYVYVYFLSCIRTWYP